MNRSRSTVATVGFLAIAPIAVFLVLRVSPFFRLNNGDPYIYTGYATNFRNLVERFGYTYYSVRFGLIFPLRAAMIFGPFWGYVLLRYALLQIVGLSVFAVLRSRSLVVAVIGYLFAIANPVTLQAVLTTHPDTIVVPVLTAIVALLILATHADSRRVYVAYVAVAGVLAGVGVNANVFASPLIALTFLVFVVDRLLRREWWKAAILAGLSFVGAVAVTATGALVYWRLFDDADIITTTRNAVEMISGSGVWRSPSAAWLEFRYYAYAPLVALTAGIAQVTRLRFAGTPDRDLELSLATLGAILAFYCWHQFLGNGTSIEQAYYYSYLIGPTCLVLALVLITASWRIPNWWWLLVPIIPAWLLQIWQFDEFWLFLAIGVALTLVVVLIRRTEISVLAALVAMHICWGMAPRNPPPIEGGGFAFEPRYEQVVGDADAAAFESYMIGAELPNHLPSIGVGSRPLLFWYPRFDAALDRVQATYLWENLTVQRSDGAGMPELLPADVDRVRSVMGGFIVQMARTPEELSAGVDALSRAGFDVRQAETFDLSWGGTTVWFAVVEVNGERSLTG